MLEHVGEQVVTQSARAAVVAVDVLGAVEHHAGRVVLGVLPRIGNLLGDFGPVAGGVARRGEERDAVAGIVMAVVVLGDVTPPVGQRAERVGRVVGLPVELRRDIVDGALLQPCQRVAVDAVKLPVAARGARCDAVHVSRGGGGAGDTRGADAEAHLGLHVLYHVVDVPHHHVDVVAAPVGKGHVHGGIVPQVVVGGRVVGGNAVGIEIVVKDDAVHIIFGDDFLDDVDDALARGGEAGVEDGCRRAVAGVGQQHAGIHKFLVLRCIPVGPRAPAIGVYPGVALDAALVALLDGISQGVVARVLAARAGQVTRPGLITGLVEGVTHRAHLQEDGVDVLLLETVQIGVEFVFLCRRVIDRCGPVDAVDGGDPRGTHLALKRLVGAAADAGGHGYSDE